MIDIAVAWDAQLLRFDWLFNGSDLATTDTLQTAVIVSLLGPAGERTAPML